MSQAQSKLLRRPEVLARVGIKSKSHLYKMMANDLFPRPRKISAKAVGWLASDIDSWIKNRPVAA